MTEESPARTHNIAMERLKSIVERIERLAEERKALGSDIRDVFTEAKSAGFEPKVIRELLKLRKMDPDDLREQREMLDLYMHAVGMEE
jgi:Uncharacterized protein conserved in bacteria